MDMASAADQTPLRILIANERIDRLHLLAHVVADLGHKVVAQEIDVAAVGRRTRDDHPDVALVGLGISSEHALAMIDKIVQEASCPVIAILTAENPVYIREAAKHGIFAYIVDAESEERRSKGEELQSNIDITLQRFTQYHTLQGAFGRRAVIEQAKGILMARHAIDGDAAFGMLREHSQARGHKLGEVAAAIVESHLLLVPRGPGEPLQPGRQRLVDETSSEAGSRRDASRYRG
jgi:response regulator NasT